MLTWNEVQTQFENLVKFAAKNVYLSRAMVDCSVGADDLYQIGMIKLYDCWERYGHLAMEDFKKVFNTALFRAVRRGARPSGTIDLNEAISVGEDVVENEIENLSFKEGLTQLKIQLSPIAFAILSELIEPSPKTLWEVWADKARKEAIKAQGKSINLSKTTEVKMKHIRNALGITQKNFDIGISEIRSKAKNTDLV